MAACVPASGFFLSQAEEEWLLQGHTVRLARDSVSVRAGDTVQLTGQGEYIAEVVEVDHRPCPGSADVVVRMIRLFTERESATRRYREV